MGFIDNKHVPDHMIDHNNMQHMFGIHVNNMCSGTSFMVPNHLPHHNNTTVAPPSIG